MVPMSVYEQLSQMSQRVVSAMAIWRQRRIVPEGMATQISRHRPLAKFRRSARNNTARRFFSRLYRLDPTQEFLRDAIELRSEFFHCGVFAGNFTSLSTVQRYLCGD